jgi:hypothetical protein
MIRDELTKPSPALKGSVSIPGSQLDAVILPLRAQIQELYKLVAKMDSEIHEIRKSGVVILQHESAAATPSPTAWSGSPSAIAQQFVHYRLPFGPRAGQAVIARITGPGSKGAGYINLRVELNGDEGLVSGSDLPKPAWLLVTNAPFSTRLDPDTWNFGVYSEGKTKTP